MLTQSQADLLKRMQTDAIQAGPPFCAKEHWERVHVEFNRVFGLDDGIADNVEDQSFNNHFSSWSPSFSAYYVYACMLYYRILRTRDRWGVLDRVQSMLPKDSPRRTVIYNRPLSWDVLISVDTLLTIAEVSPNILTTPCAVGEIGGGWGRIGFTLLQANPSATYLDFDLPETLLIAQTYLPKIMPNQQFIGYDEARQTDLSSGIARTGWIWFAGAYKLKQLPDHDLDYVISVASFQEMTNDYVSAYFDLIDRVTKVFYLQQEKGNGTNGGYFPFKPAWRALVPQRDPLWRSDAFEAVFEVKG